MRKIGPAMVIAAAVLGFGAPAQAAEAAAPVVHWANQVEDDLGRLQVYASSDAGVTGLVAHVRTPGTGAEVAVMTSFQLASGTAEDGVWQSGEIVIPDLGYYDLDVEVTDADGGRIASDGFGFNNVVKMFFADLKTTPTVTYTRRTYTVSGKLMGLWPGTRATAPVSGVPVYAQIPGGDFTAEIETGSKGQFSLSGAVGYADGGGGYLSTTDDPDHRFYLQGFTRIPKAEVKQSPTRVTMQLDRNSIISRQPITVSGDATWKSPDGWVPMANAPIAIGVCGRGYDDPTNCFSGPTTTTDANGHYSYVINPYDGGGIAVAASSDDMYIQTVTYASRKITVLMPTSFEGFYAGRDSDGGRVYVGTSGGLELTGYSPAADTVVSAQFSPNGVTGWRTIGDINLGQSPGSSFSAAFEHSGAGYWRLSYAGVKGLLAPAKTDPIFVG